MRLQIIQNNYIHAPEFIEPSRAKILTQEFLAHVHKYKPNGDTQAPRSPSVHNFLPFVKLLVEKTPHVSDLLGEPVLPTYAYARTYVHGEVLHRHRDRPACEISITLNLKKDVDWALGFQRPDNSEAHIELNPGDAVMYLGCQADHWRDAYKGHEHVQVFLHYVRANGSKSWAFFDRQVQQNPTQPDENLPDLPVTVL